ncbi:cysteine-rich receptor-like protein kinase 8 [Tanacetum coccineum]
MTNNTNSSNSSQSTSNTGNNDDINSVYHPLFFHQNDHPGLVLNSKKLTGSNNYSSWKRLMMIAFSVRNKLKLINREFEEPTVELPIRPFLERANDMLNEHYAQLDGHKIYQVSNEIANLKQGNTTIELYHHKLKGLWDELDALKVPYACACRCDCTNRRTNGERDQRKRLIQFLILV